MTWSENWRHEERPDPSEIPKEYNRFKLKRVINKPFIFFISGFIGFYLLLKIFGGEPLLIGGYPILMWMTLAFMLYILIGVYVFLWPTETGSVAKAADEREVDS